MALKPKKSETHLPTGEQIRKMEAIVEKKAKAIEKKLPYGFHVDSSQIHTILKNGVHGYSIFVRQQSGRPVLSLYFDSSANLFEIDDFSAEKIKKIVEKINL